MLLEVENLEVKYGNIQALHGISFHVNEGEIVTLIGANGAGKTTSLYTIARLPPPEAPRVIGGDIRFQGESILKTRPSDVVKKLHLALSPEGRRIFGNLTVMENLQLATYSREKGADLKKEYDYVFELFPRLKERHNQRSESLSGGEQQMLAVGRALARDIKLLLLDEPYEGLAPVIVQEIEKTLQNVKKLGITTIIVEQNAIAALKLADRAIIMDSGEIVFDGTAQAVLDNEELRDQYLAI